MTVARFDIAGPGYDEGRYDEDASTRRVVPARPGTRVNLHRRARLLSERPVYGKAKPYPPQGHPDIVQQFRKLRTDRLVRSHAS